MKIIRERVYTGPNLYAYRPVICLQVDLAPWQNTETSQIPNFYNDLVELLPTLTQHHCSRGREGGFLERVAEGTYLGHVIEHVALELSTLAGEEVFFGSTRSTASESVYNVVYAYKTPQVGLAAGRFATSLVEAIVTGKETGELFPQMQRELKELVRKYGQGPSTEALVSYAKERGIPILPLVDGNISQLGYGAEGRRLSATITSNTSALAVDLACDKWATRCLLHDIGLPVPEGRLAKTWEEAEAAVRELGFPLVIKPVSANQGKGVSAGIDNIQKAKAAWALAHIWGDVLVEKQIQGRDWRLLVAGGKLIAASLRRPPFVMGDGQRTVEELIAEINANSLRGVGHEKPLTKLQLDEVTLGVLQAQGYSPNSIPSCGIQVQLRHSGNLSTGGTAEDVTEIVHPQNQELAQRAVRILGLDVAGVDVICQDLSIPIVEQAGAIIEVNAAPGLRMHLYPSVGEARPVAQEIIDQLFPKGQGRIPLVAVTGTNGKTTTVRMLGHALARQGLTVGTATTDGIYLDGKLLVEGDNTGPWSAQVLLKDPAVQAAVLEVARGGILRGGLGYDKSQVAVITNISDDHLGLEGIETVEELAQVKSLVAECVLPGGWVVLNADEPQVVAMAKRVPKNASVLYYSTRRNNKIIRRHVKDGGAALYLEGKKLIWEHGPLPAGRFWAPISQYPATLAGELLHNMANLLAAIGAALALELTPAQIEEALLAFPSDPVYNPGRFNIFELGTKKVIVDYGHNPAGFSTTLVAAKKIAPNLIGVIGAPGDRRDDAIRTMGQIAGQFCERLIIKEDQDLRGRRKGEVAQLLKEGALAAGKAPGEIKIIHDEVEALRYAIGENILGDVLIFYESWSRVHREITLFSAEELVGGTVPLQAAMAIKSKAK